MIVSAFFISSGNPFQACVTDGRKELKYCCDFAGTVWRSASLRKGYLAVLPTVGGTSEERYFGVIPISMLHLIIKYKLMFFPSRSETFPARVSVQ